MPRPPPPPHPIPPHPLRQILLNLRRGDSGELSLLSCALSLAGNLARVFTTLTLVGDPIILGSAATQVRRSLLRGGEGGQA